MPELRLLSHHGPSGPGNSGAGGVCSDEVKGRHQVNSQMAGNKKKSSPQAAFSINRFLSDMAVDSMAPSLLYTTPGAVN